MSGRSPLEVLHPDGGRAARARRSGAARRARCRRRRRRAGGRPRARRAVRRGAARAAGCRPGRSGARPRGEDGLIYAAVPRPPRRAARRSSAGPASGRTTWRSSPRPSRPLPGAGAGPRLALRADLRHRGAPATSAGCSPRRPPLSGHAALRLAPAVGILARRRLAAPAPGSPPSGARRTGPARRRGGELPRRAWGHGAALLRGGRAAPLGRREGAPGADGGGKRLARLGAAARAGARVRVPWRRPLGGRRVAETVVAGRPRPTS